MAKVDLIRRSLFERLATFAVAFPHPPFSFPSQLSRLVSSRNTLSFPSPLSRLSGQQFIHDSRGLGDVGQSLMEALVMEG